MFFDYGCFSVLFNYGCFSVLFNYGSCQTPEICLAAVKHDTNALYYVQKQTLVICMAAKHQMKIIASRN